MDDKTLSPIPTGTQKTGVKKTVKCETGKAVVGNEKAVAGGSGRKDRKT